MMDMSAMANAKVNWTYQFFELLNTQNGPCMAFLRVIQLLHDFFVLSTDQQVLSLFRTQLNYTNVS